ncbi:MAG: alpha/beta hydrolase [Solirubrobacteraceae bacterium]|nr:alpha/beta hydrolase [Solirubrobacteraceae bacterium]
MAVVGTPPVVPPLASPRSLVEAAAVRAVTALPDPVQTAIAGGPVHVDGQTLDPSARLLLRAMGLVGRRALDRSSPDAMRRAMRRAARQGAGPRVAVASVRDIAIPGPVGPIGVRHYAPPPSGPSWSRPGALLYVHGGGYVCGDLDTHDAPCRILCREAGVHVVAVDYALAPERPFPAATDDVRAAWRWLVEHAEELGADPTRIAVGGDSAGGNLSAGLAIATRDAGERAPDAQLLLYPAVSADHDHPSFRTFGEGYLLEAADVWWFEAQRVAGTDVAEDDPRLAPLEAADPSGLAPAIVVTAGFDPLRDEGRAYARRLRDAGVPVVAWCETSLMHGFVNAPGIGRAGRRAIVDAAAALRDALDETGVRTTGRAG